MLDLLARLRCPDDGAAFVAAAGGRRVCGACGRGVDSAAGTLSLLPATPAHPTTLAERAGRDAQASRYDSLRALRWFSRLEVPALLGALTPRPGEVILDLGCGTGRLTLPLLAHGANVLAVDHSAASLAVLARKVPEADRMRLLLLHADATRLPLAAGSCEGVVSAQVLEHVPTPHLRTAFIAELARVLQVGGRVALTAYRAWPALPCEGVHPGGLPYRRFGREELRGLLAAQFPGVALSGRLGYVWLAALRRL